MIAYTAFSHENDIKKCMEMGFDHVLNKPAMPNQIWKTIEKMTIN